MQVLVDTRTTASMTIFMVLSLSPSLVRPLEASMLIYIFIYLDIFILRRLKIGIVKLCS